MSSKIVNPGMELNVLSFIIDNPDYFFINFGDFQPKYFSVNVHREVFKYILKLRKDGDKIPSFNAFKEVILSSPDIEHRTLELIPKVLELLPSHTIQRQDLDLTVKTLIELHATRDLVVNMNSIAEDIQNTPIDENIQKLEKKIQDLKEQLSYNKPIDMMSFKNDLDKRMDYAKAIHDNPDQVGMVRTGLKNFDNFFPRQAPGQFIIFQARTNVGKSMFLKNVAVKNYEAGLKVIVVTIEMNAMEWANRIDSALTGIKHSEFTKGTISQSQDLLDIWRTKVRSFGTDKNKNEDLILYWQPDNCTPARLEALIARNPFKPDVIVVDYAGDLKSGLKGMGDYDARAHAEIYAGLKRIAGTYKAVLYTAQQTKRGIKKVTDESGAWSDVASAKADMMIAIEQTKEDEIFEVQIGGRRFSQRLTVTVIKGRHIPKGCYTKIIPDWEHMTWIEQQFDNAKFEGRSDDADAKKDVPKKAANDSQPPTDTNTQDEMDKVEIPVDLVNFM